MGNYHYYLVSPDHERVLDCGQFKPEVPDGESDIVTLNVSYCRVFSPEMALAVSAWLMHYGGNGMRVECDETFTDSWEDAGQLPEWCTWPKDRLYQLSGWLFGAAE